MLNGKTISQGEKMSYLQNKDPDIYVSIVKEQKRQEEGIELIASENLASQAVMEAQGSILTNKYAEGYPRKRYYGGCQFIDELEQIAIDRAQKLFGAEHANVQAHSGSQANMAVYLAELAPGDKVMGMNLAEGGHLTHGSKVNFSGKLFEIGFYGINEQGFIDYDRLSDQVKEFKPKMIIAGASSYSRVIDFKKFREIADKVGAILLVDMAHIAGLVAAEIHPSPVPYADYITSTTHKTLRGPRGGLILTSKDNAKKINSIIFPGIQGGPLEHVIAAKAVCFGEALKPGFKAYQEKVVKNAKFLASEIISQGFEVVSGGTDNHLMLVSLIKKGITGKDLEENLDKVGITLNKNTVPKDPQSPFVTSGVRIGTPTITTRGMGVEEMKKIAGWISIIADNLGNDSIIKQVHAEVVDLAKKFSIYF